MREGLKGVILDRDGVLNANAAEGDYIRTPAELHLLPGAAEALKRLNDAGLLTFLASNQRGVSRGLMTAADLDAVHATLVRALADEAGAALTKAYYCPHGYADTCGCRKPKPGMLQQAMATHDLTPGDCIMIGDSPTDIGAAKNAGVGCIYVGDPARIRADKPEHVAPDLLAAVEWLLS